MEQKATEQKATEQKPAVRWTLYIVGLIVLALGIILNTKTNLGVSPIISVAYCLSEILQANFGNVTFILYSSFVVIEIIIHCFLKRYDTIPKDLLQIVLSLAFTRVMNLISAFIPSFGTDLAGTAWATIPVRIFFLLIAIVLTGIGAALSLNAHLIPNPGDGIVQAIADVTGWKTGFTKNCVDITCVTTTCILSYFLIGGIVGVGIGTVLAMIGVGRVIAVFNYLTHNA